MVTPETAKRTILTDKPKNKGVLPKNFPLSKTSASAYTMRYGFAYWYKNSSNVIVGISALYKNEKDVALNTIKVGFPTSFLMGVLNLIGNYFHSEKSGRAPSIRLKAV